MKPPGTPAAPKPRHALAAAVLAAASLAAYANSFAGGFVQDAKFLILNDSRVQALNATNLGLIVSQTAQVALTPTVLYRPLNTFSYLFNYAVLGNGQNPFGYHAVNLLLHIGNAFLVYLLALLLLGEFMPAVFTAGIWALHPVTTEGVTNLVGRADEMAAMGVLGALLLYIHGTTPGVPNRWRWLAASAAVYAAGLFSKENAVVVPALVVLYDLTFRFPRERPAGAWLATARQFARGAWWVYVPPLLLFLAIRQAVVASSPPIPPAFIENPLIAAGFFSAEMTAIKILGMYLWMLVWPAELSCDYSFNQIPLVNGLDDVQALGALAVLLAVGALAFGCFRRKPVVFFLIGWWGITILPTSNLLLRIGSIMGVRFLYLPAVGFAGCLVIAVYELSKRLKWKPAAAGAVLCAIAALFATRTISRNQDYRDDEALFTSALAVAPGSVKPHMAISSLLAGKEPLLQYIDRSVAEAEAALAILKDVPAQWNHVPTLVEAARRFRDKAESVDPGSESRMPSREALMWYGRALDVLRWAVAVDRTHGAPPYEGLYRYLGRVQLRMGDGTGAVASFLQEREFHPLNTEIYDDLGRAYLAAGRLNQAAISFLQGQFLKDGAKDVSTTAAVYRMLDPGGCEIVQRDGQPALNYQCPLVVQHTCAAFGDLVKTFRHAGMDSVADSAGRQAHERYGCP